MNLNETNLPDFLLADLYKNNIVVIDNEQPGAAIPKTESIGSKKKSAIQETEVSRDISPNNIPRPLAFLGNNEKNIAIVVMEDAAIHLQDDLLDVLSPILTACKLNLADVAIVNTHTQTVTVQALKNELSPKVVLLFGVSTKTIDLPFSIPDYKVQLFDDCNYLQAASLQTMKGVSNEIKDEKRKLWSCLKTIFNL